MHSIYPFLPSELALLAYLKHLCSSLQTQMDIYLTVFRCALLVIFSCTYETVIRICLTKHAYYQVLFLITSGMHASDLFQTSLGYADI